MDLNLVKEIEETKTLSLEISTQTEAEMNNE